MDYTDSSSHGLHGQVKPRTTRQFKPRTSTDSSTEYTEYTESILVFAAGSSAFGVWVIRGLRLDPVIPFRPRCDLPCRMA